MSIDIEYLKKKIAETEILLNDYKIALRVFTSIGGEVLSITNNPTQVVKIPATAKVTVKEQVLHDIEEAKSDISTKDLINLYSQRSGKTKQVAANSIYPILSMFTKEGKIVSYKNNGQPTIGNYWKIKTPDVNQG